MTTHPSPARRPLHPAWGIAVFALIVVIGLFYVKWSPYYDRAFTAAETHSIGKSILTDADGILPTSSLQAALDYAVIYGKAIWKALLLGLLLGSAMQALLPTPWIRRWLGGLGAGSVLTGSMLSVPSMMCTCCAAPVVTGLRQCHAAPGSTVAFWLGNTMLNPATLVFMGFVLGWQWVGLRLALGLVMVLGLGWLLNHMSRNHRTAAAVSPTPVEPALTNDEQLDLVSILKRWSRIFAGMALRLLPEYLVLVLLLGAARVWLLPVLDLSIDNSLLWIIGAAIIGMLFVIPTAGEVPIVQAMLSLGIAAGPAAALLMTLPPISLPSLAMVAKSFRRTELAVLILGVVVFGVLGAGLAIVMEF